MFPTIDGFGYAVTGGSAQVIDQLNAQNRQELLKESFGSNDNSILISYLSQYWCFTFECSAIYH